MEYFEEAHVAKSAESSKRENKSEEAVKKQLKQMLYGYKNCDNEMIKNSMDIKIDCDDSSSVSGFSDLNLTESSGADDTTRATIGSPDIPDSIQGDLNVDISSNIFDEFLSDEDKKQSSKGSSLSGEVNLDTDVSCSLGSEEEDCQLENDDESLISGSLKSLSDIDNTQEFDPDGLLASKIHERLKIKNDNPKRPPKRKIEEDDESEEEIVLEENKCGKKIKDMPQVLHPSLLEDKSLQEDESLLEDKSSKTSCDSFDSSCIIETPVLSPPYVSIRADTMPKENFSDVLGGYTHATMKNISFENEIIPFYDKSPTFYSEMESFITEPNIDQVIDTEERFASDIKINDDPDMSLELEASQQLPVENSTENAICMNEEKLDTIDMLFKENVCICVMKHPTKMFVHGKLKARAIAGTVEIFGHTLTDEPQEIYAPYINFAQCFSTVEKDCTHYGLFGKITALGFNVSEAEKIVTTLGQYDCVLVLEPLRNVKFNFVEEYFSIANIFTKSSRQSDVCHTKALERLNCSIYESKPRKIFEIPLSWKDINKYCFKAQSRGIVCGGKGVGKSTCLRYHVNKILASGPVLVIDLDIGQSEFTVAGNISATVVNKPLIGPNFTHQRKPERTLNLGMINALDNMRRYVSSVIELIGYCATEPRLNQMRWVVNTMGLCNAIGLHFMTAIILHCRPTYVLQIDSKNPKKKFDIFLRPQLIAAHYDFHKNMRLFANTACPDRLEYAFIPTHHTESPKNSHSLAPRDERYMNFLAYFGELLNIHRVSSLLAITPYEVQLQDLCLYMNVKIPEGTVSQVLNGKIVALCQHKLGSGTTKVYVLADEPLLCHGHGLIRGIDLETSILYLITPMASESLQAVDALLYADWVPELRGQETQLSAGVMVPYRMPSMHQQKQLMFTPRRRFNPVQLLKMSRGS